MGWRGEARADEHPAGDAGQPDEYRRRNPEETVLHRVVRENLEDFLRSSREENGAPLPRFIERAFRAYLACGIPSAGFTRLVCRECGHEAILAFSCKVRHLCPSCSGRHMDDGAAHLLEDVLPSSIPYRHVVVSLPFEMRGLLAFHPKLLNAALRLVNDSVLRWQEARPRHLFRSRGGGVSVVQRAGGSLNVNPHIHLLLADGAFSEEKDGFMRFHGAEPPKREELALLAETIGKRLLGMLRRRGFLREGGEDSCKDEASPLEACIQAALSLGHREREGEAQSWAPDEPSPPHDGAQALSVTHGGVNVHAGGRVLANDGDALTRLVRYLLRPPFSVERFSLHEDGAVLYRLKQPDRSGRTVLLLSPVELLARLAAILPAPRFSLRREIGVFAAGSPHRRKVVQRRAVARACHRPSPAAPLPPPAKDVSPSGNSPPSEALVLPSRAAQPAPANPTSAKAPPLSSAASNSSSAPGTTRLPWAELLSRVFDIDGLCCSRCHGRMEPVAIVEEPVEIERYLRSRGLYVPLHPAARPRGPPRRRAS